MVLYRSESRYPDVRPTSRASEPAAANRPIASPGGAGSAGTAANGTCSPAERHGTARLGQGDLAGHRRPRVREPGARRVGWVDDWHGQIVGLDTAPLIYYLEEHPTYLPLVDPFFDALARGDLHAVTSTVTLIEVLTQP